MEATPKERRSGGGSRSRTDRQSSGNLNASNNNSSKTSNSRRRGQSSSSASSSPNALFGTITWILILLCCSFLSFYMGVWTGIQAASGCDEMNGVGRHLEGSSLGGSSLGESGSSVRGSSGIGGAADGSTSGGCTAACLAEASKENGELQRRIEYLAAEKVKKEMQNKLEDLCKKLPTQKITDTRNTKSTNLIPSSLSHFVSGLIRVGKDDLMKTFDFGVPPTPNTQNIDALILYNKNQALPSDSSVAKAAQLEGNLGIPYLSADKATENCDTMNVVLVNNPGNTNQCLALVGGQYQSYHVQRWMRRDKHGGVNAKFPLKLTSRGLTASGRDDFTPPKAQHVKDHQAILSTYLNNLQGIKGRLQTVLSKMNSRTVVVLTCNMGQSELLMNFICSARARGFDLNNVLLFPTDLETKELAEGLGLATFYEESIMASIPKSEANFYGDSIFTRVMFAKVFCVQLVVELGYDLLFQDVDVVWYRNPIDYFHDKSLADFDIYFQDDGSRQERYAPYSANSGFYYVRSNERTRFLFRSLLYSSDLIGAWYSHQQVLIALLVEYNSLLALGVKVFSKEMEEFPGGVQYHRNKEAMKKIFKGDSKAIIFHMSWTTNKDNKVKFFKQMGEWYLEEKCIGKRLNQITDDKLSSGNDGVLIKPCCSAAPLISCHYRDKPSKFPCLDSPFIDKKGVSFW